MEIMKSQLSNCELDSLAKLIGSTYLRLGSRHLNSQLMSDDFCIFTTSGTLNIECNLVVLDYPGYKEEYSAFAVKPASKNKAEAILRSGNVFAQHSKEKITEVYVVRETITEREAGELKWKYESDIAIILQLASGCILIQMDAHSNGVLRIEFVEAFTFHGLAPVPHLHTSNKFKTHESVLEIMALSCDLREATN